MSALVVVLAFFLLGYAFYSAMFAMAGALVPRQEEIQNVTTPIQIVLFATYFVSFQAVSEPDGGLAQVLTLRAADGRDRPAGAGHRRRCPRVGDRCRDDHPRRGAAALLLAASRVYANAVLQTGTRVRLVEAWRAR